ncbi:MAG: hypothetical protein PHO93_02285 [Candidatus Saccharimonadaceae bacterium]|nr:hypothetical protein [Candidatus Saccharimonadaceae bacterium]
MSGSPIELLKEHFRRRTLMKVCRSHLEIGVSLIDPDNLIDEQIVANRHASGVMRLLTAKKCLKNTGLTMFGKEHYASYNLLSRLIFSLRESNFSEDVCRSTVEALTAKRLEKGVFVYESKWL